MDTRAYLALHLGGTPSQETGTSPSSCQLLDNRIIISRPTNSHSSLFIWSQLFVPFSSIVGKLSFVYEHLLQSLSLFHAHPFTLAFPQTQLSLSFSLTHTPTHTHTHTQRAFGLYPSILFCLKHCYEWKL